MYEVRETKRGYAIYFVRTGYEKYISDNLSFSKAKRWCNRLNEAYDEGVAAAW